MRNFINLIENSQYGWSETSIEVFCHIFWETNHEHWLVEESSGTSSFEDLSRCFIWWENGRPIVFAVASTNDGNGDICSRDGSVPRKASHDT